MVRKTQAFRKEVSLPAPRRQLIAGVVAGQILGFVAAVLVLAPLMPAAVIVSTVAGGVLGGLAGASLKTKKAPLRDERIRHYVFEALAETSKKLNEKIKEEFHEVSGGGESDRRAMKTTPTLALKPPTPPAPPKFGGM